MKYLIAAALIALALPSQAMTWWQDGFLYGNVCRSGPYFYAYPPRFGQPVGSGCSFYNIYGFYTFGAVSNE